MSENKTQPPRPRSALVTGAGSGIGRAIAGELAAQGYAMTLTGRRKEPLERLAMEIRSSGGQAQSVVADVALPDDCAAAVQAAVNSFGFLDVLINNAGVACYGPLFELTTDQVHTTIDIDLKGPFFMTCAALAPLGASADAGRLPAVLNISSSVSLMALPNYALYSAAKAGVDMMTRCLALELAPRRIRVNAICPGVVRTPIFSTLMSAEAADQFLDEFGSEVPLRRVGEPIDIARAAEFLCRSENSWITGAVVPVDGGLSLGPNPPDP